MKSIDLDVMAEWLEGCITFGGSEITQVEVRDILQEQNIYRDQDKAQARIDEAWSELERRQRQLGTIAPFTVNGTKLQRVCGWRDVSPYSFCLTLGLQVTYKSWFSDDLNKDYNVQGDLFERLTAEALEQLGLRTYSTAWRKKATTSLDEKVSFVAKCLNEAKIEKGVQEWASVSAKDAGLDVLCHVPFLDGAGGRPVFLIQCASGEHWRPKRSTPNIEIWRKLVDFTTAPTRGIAHPFALLCDEFRKSSCFDGLALMLDRHRVCHPRLNVPRGWTSAPLSKELNKWTEARIELMLKKIAE